MYNNKKLLGKKIKIQGIVQGVGFRPFIYRIANKNGIFGKVSNTTSGVEIVAEGLENNLNKFIDDIIKEKPVISYIQEINIELIKTSDFKQFFIMNSKSDKNNSSFISPDLSICHKCKNEIKDSKNRRYKYPFTNCTDCGPRYTITFNIPYDRHNTSMSRFKMCSKCQFEYNNPKNRRFHAQPNACPKCGPNLCIFNTKGEKINSEDPILETIKLIKKGFILAIKGLGGMHIVVDPSNKASVLKLRIKKNRLDKPFALMSPNINSVKQYTFIDKKEENILKECKSPIVLLKKKKQNIIANNISPNNQNFGVMLPYTPLHYIILNKNFIALLMTSGNLNNEPISIDNKESILRLNKIADFFLLHDRTIITRCDDSITKLYKKTNRIIRRSRGYVPKPIYLKKIMPSILACGADLKNTICMTRKNNAFLSQHIGNLENKVSYDFFKTTIKNMKKILKISPKIVACDYHDNYISSQYANELKNIKIIKIQHHHAHIVSCMVENRIKNKTIGIALDGTGIGTDGTIWGGEILITDYCSFKRLCFLDPIRMPGSSKAIKEPWRMGISYLYKTFGESIWNLNLPLLNIIDKKDIEIIISMIKKKTNSPLTSSMGRFFDGIASIIGIRHKINFEGQAAIDLESLAFYKTDENYKFDVTKENKKIKLMTTSIIKNIVSDIEKKVPFSFISTKFHNTIVEMLTFACIIIRKEYNLNTVALSGGVFQNNILLDKIKKKLETNNFNILSHRIIPTNDGGISLGQAIIAGNLVI